MYGKTHYNIVISLQLIKITGKKNQQFKQRFHMVVKPCEAPPCLWSTGVLEKGISSSRAGGEGAGGLAVDIRPPFGHFTYHPSCASGLSLLQWGFDLKKEVHGLKIFENYYSGDMTQSLGNYHWKIHWSSYNLDISSQTGYFGLKSDSFRRNLVIQWQVQS